MIKTREERETQKRREKRSAMIEKKELQVKVSEKSKEDINGGK